jgi:MoCo/4Fe-4S cofactor protein with predicted Tat translocation signal
MPRYWKSVDHLEGNPAFERFIEDEFPSRSEEWLKPVNRREVMRLMAASFALAGFNACTRQPKETIVPYVRQPEEFTPGKALLFATAMPMGGYARGLLVESHLGRPTKIEGNPQHPISMGATDVFAQASLLGLYDPDRSRTVINNGRISAWVKFLSEMAVIREQHTADRGKGLRILTEPVGSPTLTWQLSELQKQFPEMRWQVYDPTELGDRASAFGQPVEILYDISKADVIVSLDCDFLATGAASVRYARDFTDRRRLANTSDSMNRLYVVEPTPSPTGGCADHRIPMRAVDLHAFASELARAVGASTGESTQPKEQTHAVTAIARDLQAHRGSSVVMVGDHLPAAVHVVAHAINTALGNIGQTVSYTQPVRAAGTGSLESLWSLVNEMRSGQVQTLLLLGGNPVFDSPSDMGFRDALRKVKNTAQLSLYQDETSEYSHWHIPAAHYLESWSDARAIDGTTTLIQPLIEPLYGGRTAHEFLAALTDRPDRGSYDILREYWQSRATGDFESYWRTALHDGVVANEARPAPVVLKPQDAAVPNRADPGLELVFRPDPSIWDGQFANNGWLQELPKPLTKLTWDNAALMSAETAQRLGVKNEDVVELRYRERSVEAPVWIVPGHANDSVCVHFGYGRRRGGKVAEGTGFDAYSFRTSDQPWGGLGLEIKKTGRRYKLAATQDHHSMEGRPIVRSAVIDEFRKDPQFAIHEEQPPEPTLTLYPEFQRTTYAWGMAIDHNACVGCNACVIACQAENNVPVVGKNEVLNAREMHWIRIDRYFEGKVNSPHIFYQPMLCQHCEKAPCEVVCPVAATVHSDEGLNEMVYNRCVGTRYCSNNCPYKVRRFNFFLYSDWFSQSLYGMRNPEVTVRSRGVMEKCTYCVQRIQSVKIEAEKDGRMVKDGEIQTACEQVCPGRAIVFGNINDPNSRVSQAKAQTRSYGVLADLNTRPRTTYLARVTNPNPELGGAQS